jgi:hypothetical protein
MQSVGNVESQLIRTIDRPSQGIVHNLKVPFSVTVWALVIYRDFSPLAG